MKKERNKVILFISTIRKKKDFWKVFVGDGIDVTILVDADLKG